MTTEKHDYIDALRGYAILLVILVHASQAAASLPPAWQQFLAQGARGVQLFFVASALTLLMSWHRRQDGVLRFYARRLFRIAPMFWLATVFFAALAHGRPHYYAPDGTGVAEIALTATFLHGWHPATINSVVPGGWSIADEMGFYLVFPLLALAIRGWKTALLALAGVIVGASRLFDHMWLARGSVWPHGSDDLTSTFLHLWLPTQMPVFLVGFVLYFAIMGTTVPRRVAHGLVAGSVLAGAWLALHPDAIWLGQVSVSLYALYACCFAVFAYGLAKGGAAALNNASARTLGRLSFSAYLWHIAIQHVQAGVERVYTGPLPVHQGVVYFLGYTALLLALTVAASSLTYRYVESPCIRLGARVLAGRRVEPAPAPA